jgi:predicted secreted protein
MAVFHGSGGSLSIGGTAVAQVQEWSVSHNAEMVETTSLGQSARSFSKGLESFEGSCEVIVSDDDDTGYTNFNQQLKTGTALSAEFFQDDNDKLSGSVLVSSVETTLGFDDIARYSVTFTGTGGLTITQDAD